MNELILAVLAAAAYFAGGLAVFVFGSSYHSLFWTNRTWVYRAALPIVAGVIAWWVHQAGAAEAVRLLSVGFLAAMTANLAGWAVAHLGGPLGLGNASMSSLALRKVLDAAAVTGSILVVLAVTGTAPAFVYLSVGNLSLGLALGFGGFVAFAVFASLQPRTLRMSRGRLLRLLPWILLFCIANAFMEELWFRGLFLRSLTSLAGVVAASLLTGAVFAIAHVGVTYVSRAERLRFLVILFPLGVAWALALHYTRSLIASTLFHAGADLVVIRLVLPALGETNPTGSEAPNPT